MFIILSRSISRSVFSATASDKSFLGLLKLVVQHGNFCITQNAGQRYSHNYKDRADDLFLFGFNEAFVFGIVASFKSLFFALLYFNTIGVVSVVTVHFSKNLLKAKAVSLLNFLRNSELCALCA